MSAMGSERHDRVNTPGVIHGGAKSPLMPARVNIVVAVMSSKFIGLCMKTTDMETTDPVFSIRSTSDAPFRFNFKDIFL
jgi:hypothetical protein